MKAYIGLSGEPEYWSAHIERSDDDPTGELSKHDTLANAVAWARERTDWVLVVSDPLQWAGSPDQQPSDVPQLWKA